MCSLRVLSIPVRSFFALPDVDVSTTSHPHGLACLSACSICLCLVHPPECGIPVTAVDKAWKDGKGCVYVCRCRIDNFIFKTLLTISGALRHSTDGKEGDKIPRNLEGYFPIFCIHIS